jgi:hypothetical protein
MALDKKKLTWDRLTFSGIVVALLWLLVFDVLKTAEFVALVGTAKVIIDVLK